MGIQQQGWFLLAQSFCHNQVVADALARQFPLLYLRCSKSVAAFSSRLTEGVLINSDSSSTASLVYRL